MSDTDEKTARRTKPGVNSLSLASLFTLTTAVAVVVWVIFYAPQLLCGLIIVALPAALRLREYLETARGVQQTLTLTEIFVGYVGASILSSLALVSLCAALVGGMAVISVCFPPEEEFVPARSLAVFAVGFTAAGCCCYFLLGDVWRFPVRFALAFGRLPNYREQIGEVAKAISLNLFVYGCCAALYCWMVGGPVDSIADVAWAFAFLLGQIATVVTAYLFAVHYFQFALIRGVASAGLAVSLAAGVHWTAAHCWELGNSAPWILVAAALIALPFFRWPATPVRPEPVNAEVLP